MLKKIVIIITVLFVQKNIIFASNQDLPEDIKKFNAFIQRAPTQQYLSIQRGALTQQNLAVDQTLKFTAANLQIANEPEQDLTEKAFLGASTQQDFSTQQATSTQQNLDVDQTLKLTATNLRIVDALNEKKPFYE